MELFYRTKGSPSYPPLIILHGLCGASDNWLPVANLLAEHFHIFLPDFRNHGQSPHEDLHDYDVLSDDIISFINGLNLPRKPFIAGHSMGGKTLVAMLQKMPEIAEKAAIIDIAPKAYSYSPDSEHIRLLEFANANDLAGFSDRTGLTNFFLRYFPEAETCQLLMKNTRKTDQGFEWKINKKALVRNYKNIAGWPYTPPAHIYSKNILFIKGEFSDYIGKDDLPIIRDFFPRAILRTIPGASHRIHAEQPELLANALSSFFLS